MTGLERTIEFALLVLLALPLARLAVNPGMHRRFRAFPPIQAFMIGSLGLYAAGLLAVALYFPSLLRPLGAVALALILAERWQGRASHGTKRGFPPGSLSFLPASPWLDPQYYMKQRERHGQVFKFRHFVHPAVGIVGLERAANFLRTNADNLAVPPAPFNAIVAGGFIRYTDGDRHRDVAGILRSAFTQSVVESCDKEFAEETRRRLATIAAKGGDGADPMPVMDELVLNEMAMCFLGMPPGDSLDKLAALYAIGDYRNLAATGRRRAAAAIREIGIEMRSLAGNGNGERRNSFLSELARTNPDAISSDEVMSNFAYTLHTARIDVHGLFMWVIALLGDNPAWQGELRDALGLDRDAAMKTGGLADRIVRETVRLHQSEFLLRSVKRPIDWEGFKIPAGWRVRICVAESHRSSEAFDDPETFDPDRFLQPPNRTRYSPFGMSPRLCPGEHLARAMGKHLVAELVSGYDVRVSGVEPAEFSGFHWRPGAGMRLAMTSRS